MNHNLMLAAIGIVLSILSTLSCIANLWLAKAIAELRLEIRNNFVTKNDCLDSRNACKEIRRLEQEARHAP
jgi:hypothetical protein